MHLLYYIVMLIVAALFTLILVMKWRKRFDVSLALIFVLITVNDLGYLFYFTAQSLGEALIAQKMIYIGGCFLPLLIFFAVIRLTRLVVPKWMKAAMVSLSMVMYALVLSIGVTRFFYENVEFSRVNGLVRVTKEYGWGHTLFNIVLTMYFLAGIGVLIYTYVKKVEVSVKILKLLMIPFLLCIAGLWIDRISDSIYYLVPLFYNMTLAVYLVIIQKISMYDIIDTGIDSLAREGDTGFISLDLKLNYLGSNEVARKIIPDIKRVSIDTSIRDYRLFGDNLIKWLDSFCEAEAKGIRRDQFTCKDAGGERIYYVNISYLYDGQKKCGYQFFFIDNTKDLKYKENLKKEVRQKTEHIVEMHNALILGMATMVESRDNSTGGHIRRTSELVRILMEKIRRYSNGEFDITDEFYDDIVKAAPMHDLGKIAVDDDILRKPGRFEPWEFEKMKEHANEGKRIVHEILKDTDDDSFRKIAENVAHYHHERWDGSGYPEGISGEQIPLEARIMAVADVYDALVSKRVYKEKMSFEKADSIIMEGMGSQFDKRLEPYYKKARGEFEEYYTKLDEAGEDDRIRTGEDDGRQ
ncbi:MAG: HD domain-containing protein [Lachnospiraceae bacterium]|nr:HD domain-containing protein [Lachnospiraceae bacterium]